MCPALGNRPLGQATQVLQTVSSNGIQQRTGFWLWRFDRADAVVSLDNFWNKTPDSALEDFRASLLNSTTRWTLRSGVGRGSLFSSDDPCGVCGLVGAVRAPGRSQPVDARWQCGVVPG